MIDNSRKSTRHIQAGVQSQVWDLCRDLWTGLKTVLGYMLLCNGGGSLLNDLRGFFLRK